MSRTFLLEYRIRSEKAEFVDTRKRVWVGIFDGESVRGLKLKI